MRKRRNLNDPKFVEEKIARGDGRGRGPLYGPWLRTHDFHSAGVRFRVWWNTTGRIHHLMSFLEYQWFVVFATDPTVIDIREQFPLLDFERVLVAAEQVRKEYPESLAGSKGNILTSDFVVTRKVGEEIWDEPYAVRYSKDTISDPFIHRQRLSGLYWEGSGSNESLLTEKGLTVEKFHSAEWLFHAQKSMFRSKIPVAERLKVAEFLAPHLVNSSEPLASIAVRVDKAMHLRPGLSIDVARWMLATGQWKATSPDPLFSNIVRIAA